MYHYSVFNLNYFLKQHSHPSQSLENFESSSAFWRKCWNTKFSEQFLMSYVGYCNSIRFNWHFKFFGILQNHQVFQKHLANSDPNVIAEFLQFCWEKKNIFPFKPIVIALATCGVEHSNVSIFFFTFYSSILFVFILLHCLNWLSYFRFLSVFSYLSLQRNFWKKPSKNIQILLSVVWFGLQKTWSFLAL